MKYLYYKLSDFKNYYTPEDENYFSSFNIRTEFRTLYTLIVQILDKIKLNESNCISIAEFKSTAKFFEDTYNSTEAIGKESFGNPNQVKKPEVDLNLAKINKVNSINKDEENLTEEETFQYRIKKWMIKNLEYKPTFTEKEINRQVSIAEELKYFNLEADESTLLGKYKVIKKIGEGSFGVVYKCKLINTEIMVGVKVINLTLAKKKFKIKEADIIRETELLKEIDSPYVMKINESKIMNDNLYLVCELVEGKELLEILDIKGALNEELAKSIIFKVVTGASHLHSKNIVHRDLKLENILVSFDGNNNLRSVKIIDLGLGTKIYGEAKGFFGTPNYMPPEVFLKEGYDCKFDVFSIGVMLFTLLACDFPFNDNSVKGLALKIQNNEPDWDRLKNKCSVDCINFIKRLLEKDKTKRISTDVALEDPWFKRNHYEKNSAELSDADKTNALYSLRSYNKFSKLYKAFRIINSKLTSSVDSVRKFRDIFLRFDECNNGFLNIKDFKAMMKYISADSMDELEVEKLFNLIDINSEQRIEYDAFVSVFFENKLMNEEILVEYIFTQMDYNGQKFLKAEQLQNFFGEYHIDISPEELEALFNRLDKDNDGIVSLKDFKTNIKNELRTASLGWLQPQDESQDRDREKDRESLNRTERDEFNRERDREKDREVQVNALTFTCIKEPRHEFFSYIKRKNRIFRMEPYVIKYYDESMALMGKIEISSIKEVVVHSRRDLEIFSRLKIHWLELTDTSVLIEQILVYFKDFYQLNEVIKYTEKGRNECNNIN